MSISYRKALEGFKAKFEKSEWEKRERNRAKLKSFARVSYVGDAIFKADVDAGQESVFVKPFKFSAAAQINTGVEALRNLRMINEFLISALCNQIGLEGAVYFARVGLREDPNYQQIEDVRAKVDMPDELVSENFLKENEELFDLEIYDYSCKSGNNLQSLFKYIEGLQKKDPSLIVNEAQLKEKFLRLVILDLVTLQLDRHEGNIPLVIDKKKNSLSFGKVFDSEYAFAIKALCKYDFDKDAVGLQRKDGKIDVDKVVRAYDWLIENGEYMWTISSNCETNYHACIGDIVSLAEHSEKVRSVVLDVVGNLNAEQAISEIESKGVKIGQGYKNFVCKIVSYGKSQLEKELSHIHVLHEDKRDGSGRDR